LAPEQERAGENLGGFKISTLKLQEKRSAKHDLKRRFTDRAKHRRNGLGRERLEHPAQEYHRRFSSSHHRRSMVRGQRYL